MTARWRGMVALTVIAGISAIVVLGSNRQTSATNPALVDWPPFEMIYISEGHFNGLAQPASTETWSLVWHDARDWEKTVVASTAHPDTVGDVYRFTDGRFIVDQATINEDIVRDQDGGLVVPEPWLVPGRDAALVGKGYAELSQTQLDRVVYQRDDVVPCQPDPAGQMTGVGQPESCRIADSYTMRETITYRTDLTPPIPVKLITTIDGEVVSDITVTDLALLPENGT